MNNNNNMTTLPKKGLKTRLYNMDMNTKNLERLSKSQFIELLLKQEAKKPIPPPRTGKWKSVNEDIIIPPPEQFRDGYKPIPKPRTDRQLQMQNARRPPKPTRKPPPSPLKEYITDVSSKIKELNRALKGHAKSYGIELQDNLNPLNHFTKAKALVESHLEDLLKTMKGFKFIETLEMTFIKIVTTKIDSINKLPEWIYKTAFFNGKAKTITKASDIEPELSMSRQEILNVIDKWVSEGSGWTIDRIDSHYINVTTYQPLHGSSYLELPAKLRNSAKGLINLKNKDNECFRWSHIRHLNPQKANPLRIKKEDKRMVNELNYDGIAFPVTQKQYNKIETQNSIRINVFRYEKEQPFPILISKEKFEDQMNLLFLDYKRRKKALRPHKGLQFVHV